MKKVLFSAALALAMGSMASAQTATGRFEFSSVDRMSFSVPKEFSYNGIPRLVLSCDDSSEKSFQIFDENIEKVKTIRLAQTSFDYQLAYQIEEREVKSVDEKVRSESGTYNSLEEFIQHESMLNPSFTADVLIFSDMGNGDRRVDFDFDKMEDRYGDKRFFHQEYFGSKYPLLYGIEHDGKFTLYRVLYTVAYTDWTDKGEKTEDYSESVYPLQLVNVNLNQDANRASEYFYLSQTLFNEDEGYEYLVPKYKLVEESVPGSISSDISTIYPGVVEEPIELTRKTLVTKASNVAMVGFQVVGEDGTVLQDLDFDGYLGGSSVNRTAVITIGSNTYLAFDGYDSGNKSATIFYKLDRTTSSIQKVRTLPGGMSLSPAVANKGTDIHVNFGDGNAQGSEISVFSANGTKVKSLMVPAGHKYANFQVNGSSGVYMVNRTQKGKANDTKKIIIK